MSKISWVEFFTIKCNEFKNIRRNAEYWDAYHWGGPMNTETYNRHLELKGKPATDEMNMKRSRTYIGWLAVGFFNWVKTFNRAHYGA